MNDRIGLIVLAAAIVIAAIILACAFRYGSMSDSNAVYVYDHWTGRIIQ